ncbi:paraquat-inducible protein A [Acidocella sp.]|uniref:paraquat-inducible protein A n=1 Tax=Acidocella sp. TaxID=50710 RepID=UPI003D06B6CF
MTEAARALPGDHWRECPHCGQLSRLSQCQPGLIAECPRCGSTLWRVRRANINFPLACAIAGLLFYIFALVAPFIEITAYGRFAMARIETGPVRLSDAGWGLVGSLVFAVTLVVPGIKLGIVIATLLGIESHLPKTPLRALFRWYALLSPWAMIDVYLLGFLVAYTRLTGMFTVHLDTALYALIGLMIALAAVDASLDQEMIWRKLDESDKQPPSPTSDILSCEICGQVNHTSPGHLCQRCHSPLYPRKPASISRSWAFTIAAACLYIPANLYPFMSLTSLAQTQSYTILGGIIELADAGLWPLALLVLFASITIPLLKLAGLAYMLIGTQRGTTRHLRGRTTIYKVIDFIGRWSMIDIFMVSILVALVHFGRFANVSANVGAMCFAAVVVLTILAVNTFDPRLMWDHHKEPEA